MKIAAAFLAALLSGSPLAALAAEDPTLLQRAHQAYLAAERLHATLKEKPEIDRTRIEYLKVIDSYQRVYMITPHTPFADDALVAIARLYEETNNTADAIKTLKFLLRNYPATPFKSTAEKDLIRLTTVNVQKPVKEVADKEPPRS